MKELKAERRMGPLSLWLGSRSARIVVETDAVGLDRPDALRLARRNIDRQAHPNRQKDMDLGRNWIEQMGDEERGRLATVRWPVAQVHAAVGEARCDAPRHLAATSFGYGRKGKPPFGAAASE